MVDEARRGGRTFSQDEVNVILARAVERQSKTSGGLTHDELVDVARQAGISVEAIEAAVHDLDAAPLVPAAPATPALPSDEEVRTAMAVRTWKARRSFAIHFTIFAMLSVLLAFINLQTWQAEHFVWCIIPILAWGTVIGTHFTRLLFGHVMPDPRAVETVRAQLAERAGAAGSAAKESGARDAAPNVRIQPAVRAFAREPDEHEFESETRAGNSTRRT